MEHNSFHRHASSWYWDYGVHTDPSLLERFVSRLSQAEKLLQEKIAIDRWAANFFKTLNKKTEHITTRDGPERLLLRSELVLDESTVEGGQLLTHPVDRVENLTRSGPWRQECLSWNFPEEAKLLPKETLPISKDIPRFIKTCVKYFFTLPEPTRMGDASHAIAFLLEEFPAVQDAIEPTSAQEAFKVPDDLDVQKETDSEYLDEELTSRETSEALFVAAPAITFSSLPVKHRFIVETQEVADNQPISFQIQIGSWEEKVPHVDYKVHDTLEKYLLDEEMTRGAEFRLDAPFMSDEPTFQEARTPFEYTSMRIPSLLSVREPKIKSFYQIIAVFDEREFTHEEVNTEFVEMTETSPYQPTRVPSSETFMIEANKTDNFEGAAKQGTVETEMQARNKKDEYPTNLGLTLVQDSAIHVNEMEKTTTQSTEKTTLNTFNASSLVEFHGNTSTAATKMHTFLAEDTQATDKRTIDDDLENLMSKKRKTTLKSANSTRQPILDLLRGANSVIDTTVLDGDTTIRPPTPKKAPTFKTPHRECTHTIGFNSSFTNKYQKHLNFLTQKTNINVIELDLDELDVDWLISAECGVVIVDLALVDQCQPGGDLVIQERVVRCKRSFDKLIVLVLADYVAKRETVSAFQLTLAMMGIDTVVVQKDVENICDWICEVAEADGDDWSEDKIHITETREFEFLLDCALDPFSAVEILSLMSVFEFVSLDTTQREKLQFLTAHQLMISDTLFSTEWSIE